EGVVRGNDDALVGGNALDARPQFGVERLQRLDIGGGIGLVALAAGGVGGAEGVGDVADIDDRVRYRLEGVRIDRPMVVMPAVGMVVAVVRPFAGLMVMRVLVSMRLLFML